MRAEALGHQQRRRAGRVERAQQVLGGAAVDVAQEVHAHAAVVEIAQRVHRQPRPEVRAADADVDHVGDAAVEQRLLQAVHAARAPSSASAAPGGHRALAEIAAQRVCSAGAAFAGIDLRAVEQAAQRGRHAGVVRQREQRADGGRVTRWRAKLAYSGPTRSG